MALPFGFIPQTNRSLHTVLLHYYTCHLRENWNQCKINCTIKISAKAGIQLKRLDSPVSSTGQAQSSPE